MLHLAAIVADGQSEGERERGRPLEMVSVVTTAVRTFYKVTYIRMCNSAEKSYYLTD